MQIHLVHNDSIDTGVLQILQKSLQRGSLQITPGEAAIVIAGGNQLPPLVRLALDKRLAGLSLRMQGVECLLEPFLGGFSCVHSAKALLAHFDCALNPKNAGPDRFAPLMM